MPRKPNRTTRRAETAKESAMQKRILWEVGEERHFDLDEPPLRGELAAIVLRLVEEGKMFF